MAEKMIDVMKRRTSVRTFTDAPVSPAVLEKLAAALADNSGSLFGNTPRFMLTTLKDSQRNEVGRLSTYGVVKNADAYILGAVKKSARALTDFGYAMEKNILEATALGLGTCWLGGTFDRGGFSRIMHLRDDEILPAVSPAGIPADKRSFIDGVFRFAASSRNRRPWQDVFCLGNPSEPLFPEAAGGYTDALECVRIAPSASNKQPWRVIKDKASDTFHFYISSRSVFGEIRFAEIDIGIALCHFEAAAAELGLPGTWTEGTEAPAAEGWEYILSWESR